MGDEPLCSLRYRSHLAHLKSHLAGHENGGVSLPLTQSVGWTSDEKDRFFHALCIYSRLRPDLISRAVATKTTADVCFYLDLLEEAASDIETECSRADFDIAMEVSDAWIKNEEEEACILRELEPRWEDAVGSRANVALSGEGVPGISIDQHALALARRRENILKHLSVDHLKSLDNLYQETDDFPHSSNHSGPPNPTSGEAVACMHTTVSSPSVPAPNTLSNNETDLLSNDGESQLPASFSPASRRRLQKRLYMRKRRAAAAGLETITDTTKLRPGKRKSSTQKPEGESVEGADDNSVEAQDDLVENTGRQKKRSRPSGLNRFYKAPKELRELGIDQMALRDKGLDLFHLTSLGRLMNSYHDAYAPPDQAMMSISIDTVQLFNAIVTDFITEAVHRSIILRGQEVRLKGQSKVWRAADGIARENVERALSIMGAPFQTRQSVSQTVVELGAFPDGAVNAEDILTDRSDDDDVNKSDVASDTEITKGIHFALPSLHSELNLAIIRLASGPSSDIVMSAEIDEENYMMELDEEEELDEQDQNLEREYEADLWEHQDL